MDNIFMADRKPIQFEEYLKYDENSRGNLGEELPVRVYRLLEYSLKEELLRRYGKDEQVEVFRSAGRMVAEDADCSGLPVLGETVCNYDEGFIAGILSVYSGKQYTAIEVDCWATGDRVCRFHANVEE